MFRAGIVAISYDHVVFEKLQLERFAELVRQDETKSCAEHYLAIMRDSVKQAVLKEREACAKLCDDWLVKRDDICEVAKAIRARGNT
jgi:hypothetical protein